MKAAMLSSTALLALAFVGCGSPPPARNVPKELDPEEAASRPAVAAAGDVQIPSGALLAVRVDQALSTSRNRTGDTFDATLDEPVTVDGALALARGTKFTGHVTISQPSGRLEANALLALTLDAFESGGRSYRITTSLGTGAAVAPNERNTAAVRAAASTNRRDVEIAAGSRFQFALKAPVVRTVK